MLSLCTPTYFITEHNGVLREISICGTFVDMLHYMSSRDTVIRAIISQQSRYSQTRCFAGVDTAGANTAFSVSHAYAAAAAICRTTVIYQHYVDTSQQSLFQSYDEQLRRFSRRQFLRSYGIAILTADDSTVHHAGHVIALLP